MVTVNFRLTAVGRVELDIATPLEFAALLKLCGNQAGYSPGDCIGVKNGQVLRGGDIIVDGDTVDIFPALSGG
jgi:molybdopterin converting factor small subunit